MEQIASCVEKFGGEPKNLVGLGKSTPRNLKYSTILTAKKRGYKQLDLVRAVYEWQYQPMMYMVEGSQVATVDDIKILRRILAMRGDTPYLGVAGSSQLEVYSLGLDNKSLREARVQLRSSNKSQLAIIAELGNCRPDAIVNNKQWISKVILNLLNGTINRIIQIENYSNNDKDVAISLVGRALFARFLADRNMIPRELQTREDFGDLFDNKKKAQVTSTWLDKTFNGDFLPLPNSIFSDLSKDSWFELGKVMEKAPDNQLYLGWQQKWDRLDFAHIPVGILSQAYEEYLRKHYGYLQKKQGGYYTTSTIANIMVSASFRSLAEEKPHEDIKVLDPAVGAGVFLISAFRELVIERWRKDNKRPTTRILREILNNQIKGFDLNESALKFAALGLYLISIELDPKPVGNIKFNKLRGRVLFNVSKKTTDGNLGLGSLGDLVSNEHNGAYDLIIGNPPWTSRERTPDWNIVIEKVKMIAKKRGIEKQEILVPNGAHDLAFLWYSMKWAKPGAQISMLMNARLLFKQGSSLPNVRKVLFDKLDFQVVVNCSELRQTNFLSNTQAPFCMIFAKNSVPGPDSLFYMMTPRIEERMNDNDFIRLDTENGNFVDPDYLQKYSWTLKALAMGSQDDLAIYSRMHGMQHPTLKVMLENLTADLDFNRRFSTGYIVGKVGTSAFTGKHDPNLRKFKSLPLLSSENMLQKLIQTESYHESELLKISYPRRIDIYRGPLLIIGQSIPEETKRIQAFVSQQDVLYNGSYYGYSFKGYPNGMQLAKYLCLIMKSNITIWQALISSGNFGIERPIITINELENFLIPDFCQLSKSQLNEIDHYYDKLDSSNSSKLKKLDEWVANLYNLSKDSQQIISDTLEYQLPFDSNRENAQSIPTNNEILQFCSVLETELMYYDQFQNAKICVNKNDKLSIYPWICLKVNFLKLSSSRNLEIQPDTEHEYLRTANNTINSPFIVYKSGTELLIGILSQNRYWNNKAARLLALKITCSEFVDSFKSVA